MTKQQKLGACLGGVFGVIVLALGWFLYSAYADHQTALDGDEEDPQAKGLNAAMVDNQNYYTQSKPFPSTGAIAAVKSNTTAYAEWKEKAAELFSHGDIPDVPQGLSGDSFKVNYLDVHLKAFRQLPGHENGRLCAESVWFGFEKYLGQANETPKDEDTPKLYKQFVIVTNVVDVFRKCGVLGIRKIAPVEKDEEVEVRKAGLRKGRKGKADKNTAPSDAPTRYEYDIEFKARASVLVKVLNALAKSPRFYVVGEFGFEYEETLKDRLDRRGSASATGEKAQRRRNTEEESGDAINPAQEFLAHMKLSVYDFGKGSASKEEGK